MTLAERLLKNEMSCQLKTSLQMRKNRELRLIQFIVTKLIMEKSRGKIVGKSKFYELRPVNVLVMAEIPHMSCMRMCKICKLWFSYFIIKNTIWITIYIHTTIFQLKSAAIPKMKSVCLETFSNVKLILKMFCHWVLNAI